MVREAVIACRVFIPRKLSLRKPAVVVGHLKRLRRKALRSVLSGVRMAGLRHRPMGQGQDGTRSL